MAHETVDQFLARKRRERSGSIEHDRVTNSSELFQIDQQRTQQGSSTRTGDSIRDLYGRFQLDAAQNENQSRGFFGPAKSLFNNFAEGDIGGIAKGLTQPLVDIPDLPGPLNLLEEGLEELTSPIGLAFLPFAPATSLGLAGARGVAARAGTKLAGEALSGGAAIAASSFVNDHLPDNTPGPLRLIANVGTGAFVGGSVSIGVSRAAKRNITEEILTTIDDDDTRRLATVFADQDELLNTNAADLARFRARQGAANDEAFQAALREGKSSQEALIAGRAAMTGEALRSADDELAKIIRGVFTPADIERFYDKVVQARVRGGLNTFDADAAKDALDKIFSGTVPQPNEFKQFNKVFGSGVERVIQQTQKSAGRQALDFALEAANVPRSIAASADMSAPFRQGVMLIGHPVEFSKSFGKMVRAFGDEDFAVRMTDRLKRDLDGTNVEITDFRAGFTNHEEQFLSRMVHEIPIFGELTKRSERAYTVFLNELRGGVFKNTRKLWQESGTPTALGLRRTGGAAPSEDDLESLGKMVNYMTGRGDARILQGDMGRTLSAFFFSPKFFISRLQAPMLLFNGSPAVRRQVAREMGAMLATGVGVLSLMKLAGAEIEINPKSSDFGKGRIGNTRLDFWGGYQQIARYMTQIATGEAKTLSTKQTIDVERDEVLWRFFRSKMSPPAGFGFDVLGGETFIGEELQPDIDSFSEQVFARTSPLFLQDVIESFRESGALVGAGSSVSAFFGVGTTSFSSTQDLLRKYGMDIAEPNERLQILAQNPDLAEELVRRNEISAQRGSEAAERRIDLDEIRLEFSTRQEAADSMLLNGRLSPAQWREQRKIISAAERNQVQSLYRDAEPGPETPLTQFFQAIDDSQDELGRVDWDAVDLWMTQQPKSTQDYIERNTGLRDTEMETAYKDTVKDLDEVGFWDISDEVWAQLAPRAGVAQSDYQSWRADTLNQLAAALEQAGMDPTLSRQEAERRLATHPIQKAYSQGVNALQQRFVTQHPALARQAASWELFSTTIGERQFLNAVR